jgi:hypothetical protein
MTNKKIFKVRYAEFPETILIYRALDIDVSNYPELDGKTDDEIIDYITNNAENMKPLNDEFYDSLEEEIRDQDIIREKVPHISSEIWVEVSEENDEEEDDDDDDEEDDDE